LVFARAGPDDDSRGMTTSTTDTTAPGVLTGKNALVTGASRGIGRAAALALGRSGARVAVNYVRNREAAREVTDQLHEAVALQGDALDAAGVRTLFAAADELLGGLDVVVLNAAAPRFGPLVDATDSDIEQALAGTVRAAAVALQEAGRRVRDEGRILVISSGAVRSPGPGAGLYGAGKTAVDHLAAVLATELGHRGVTVNSLAPGVTDTDGLVIPEEQVRAMVSATPLGRLGRPEDIGDLVALVASPQARWLTGQLIGAGGGLV
jgi:3-oxoacyl-[acyl-carrier protein] reductase